MIRGSVWKLGDNVDTDGIIAARYLDTTDPRELAAHCLEDLLPELAGGVAEGDILVAGSNFGSGSSREHAPVAIKAAGISCVIAESFARIFFRNAFNVGLPLLECPEVSREAAAGERLEIDVAAGSIKNLSSGATYEARPFPPFIRRLVEAGGLVSYARARLAEIEKKKR